MEHEALETHNPFHSLKEFVLHIVTISLGISLALAADAGVEYLHHRELAEETRATFHEQINDNRKAVADNLKAIMADQVAIEKAVGLLDNDFAGAKKTLLDAPHQFLDLDTGSWDPAVATGALNYMKLAEVHHYSQIHVAELALNQLSHEAEELWLQLSEYNEQTSEWDASDRKAVKKLLRHAATYCRWIAMREEALLQMYDQGGQ